MRESRNEKGYFASSTTVINTIDPQNVTYATNKIYTGI